MDKSMGRKQDSAKIKVYTENMKRYIANKEKNIKKQLNESKRS